MPRKNIRIDIAIDYDVTDEKDPIAPSVPLKPNRDLFDISLTHAAMQKWIAEFSNTENLSFFVLKSSVTWNFEPEPQSSRGTYKGAELERTFLNGIDVFRSIKVDFPVFVWKPSKKKLECYPAIDMENLLYTSLDYDVLTKAEIPDMLLEALLNKEILLDENSENDFAVFKDAWFFLSDVDVDKHPKDSEEYLKFKAWYQSISNRYEEVLNHTSVIKLDVQQSPTPIQINTDNNEIPLQNEEKPSE